MTWRRLIGCLWPLPGCTGEMKFWGLGIGPATLQRIIQHHGGWFTAQGVPGQGAGFCFTLPALPPPASTNSQTP